MDTRGAWGYHLIIDAADCDRKAIMDPEVLKNFSNTLVEKIDMVKYGEPQIVHFGHNEDHLAGWTIIQLIETSTIMCHFCDNTGEGYIDIFSCKEYDTTVAEDVIKTFFNPSNMKKTYLVRQA